MNVTSYDFDTHPYFPATSGKTRSFHSETLAPAERDWAAQCALNNKHPKNTVSDCWLIINVLIFPTGEVRGGIGNWRHTETALLIGGVWAKKLGGLRRQRAGNGAKGRECKSVGANGGVHHRNNRGKLSIQRILNAVVCFHCFLFFGRVCVLPVAHFSTTSRCGLRRRSRHHLRRNFCLNLEGPEWFYLRRAVIGIIVAVVVFTIIFPP